MSAVAAGVLLVCGLFVLNRDDSQQVDLSAVLAQLRSGKTWSAKVIEDERQIEITTADKKHFHAYWRTDSHREELVKELRKAEFPGGYSVEVPVNRQ
ncbi:hypothetical protein [Streptosporangium carneum]|uniref:Uncharacterized protein n=1 Tax=Streptosporangium carneum TaxID=47481 RepID=A0A9W6I3J9_9ACTN|nr:hypothetical protein [Streptosporangium carneum]GLK11417.1 hypothetical protein GCM10017600_48240 [Streptosporangium carneum]